jgi:hypothetical protein
MIADVIAWLVEGLSALCCRGRQSELPRMAREAGTSRTENEMVVAQRRNGAMAPGDLLNGSPRSLRRRAFARSLSITVA